MNIYTKLQGKTLRIPEYIFKVIDRLLNESKKAQGVLLRSECH